MPQRPSRGGCCPAAVVCRTGTASSNRPDPTEAGAALRSRGIRPPELQEPLPCLAEAVRGSSMDGSGGCYPREPLRESLRESHRPAVAAAAAARLLPREGSPLKTMIMGGFVRRSVSIDLTLDSLGARVGLMCAFQV